MRGISIADVGISSYTASGDVYNLMKPVDILGTYTAVTAGAAGRRRDGLFVTNRTSTGFEVRAKTSARTAAFSYRVVARRKDIAPARFAKMTLPTTSLEEIKARLAKAD